MKGQYSTARDYTIFGISHSIREPLWLSDRVIVDLYVIIQFVIQVSPKYAILLLFPEYFLEVSNLF